MAANKEMIDAFVDGRLSADDHELMVHHISSCTECAGAVIAALAEAARALSESSERMPGGWSPTTAGEPQLALIEAPGTAAEGQPAIDLLQLDLVMDHSAGSVSDSDLLLRPEQVQEIALDELPALEPMTVPAPSLEPEADTPDSGTDLPPADAAAIASVTAAGVAESAAHGAAALASMAHHEALEEPPESAFDVPLPGSVELDQVAPEPVVTEPVAGEPVAVEPVAVEPVAVEPVAVEPVAVGAVEAEPAVPEQIIAAPAVAEGDAAIAELFETILLEPIAEPVEPLTANGIVDGPAEGLATLEAEAQSLEAEAQSLEAEAQSFVPTDPAPAIPVEERADRIPESERAAIAMAARLGSEDPLPTPRRWTVVLPAAFVFLMFAALAALAAVQLRGFAALDERTPTAAAPAQPVATVALGPVPSVLAGPLDSAVYGTVLDLTDSQDSLLAVALAAEEAGDAPPAGDVETTERPGTPAPPGSTGGRTAEGSPGRPAPATRPPQPGAARAVAGISPAAPDAFDAPRLLRTTTHRTRPDTYLVLREYDTSAPAPAPRPGVNEYRWRDASAGRLYVLSGTVAVAELRAYGRQLQNGRGQ